MAKNAARFLACAIVALFFASLSAEAGAKQRKPKPAKRSPASIVFGMYPELRGSAGTLKKFNDIADEAGLPRIDDRAELELRVGFLPSLPPFLVRVPEETPHFFLDKNSFKECFLSRVRVKKRLVMRTFCFGDRRYLAEPALNYLNGFSEAHSKENARLRTELPKRLAWKRFKTTSLVRTVEYQAFLSRRNRNARQALCGDEEEERDRCSAHVRGYAFDVSAKDMKIDELLWIAGFLSRDIAAGKILAIYEARTQANFHVMVIPQEISQETP